MKKLFSNRWLFFPALLLAAFSCGDDGTSTGAAPVASFQFEIDATDFLTVKFSNFSKNADQYSWNFGDGTAVSTDKNPSHQYDKAGTYTVVLSATGSGQTVTQTKDVVITDPNIERTKLTGETSKKWKLIRDISTGHFPFAVGPAERNDIWYALGRNEALGLRPCLLNDEFIFSTDGKYEYKTNGDVYADAGVWNTSVGAPNCVESTDANFINVDGADISDWNSGVHTFTYDNVAKKLTVTGSGAFIGIAKVASTAEVKVPQASVTYSVVKLVDAAVDTLIVETTLTGPPAGYWRFVLVSYDNPLSEPAMPQPPGPVDNISDVNFDFETETPTWAIFGGTDGNAAGITLSRIANPQSSGINTSGFVMQINQTAGVQGWAGISTDLTGKVDFTAKQTFKVKVWSPAVGMIVKLKMEDITSSGNNKEIDATTTVANQWEELTYTFTAEDANKWNKFILFFDFQTAVKTNTSSFLFDSIILQ